jgi:uncharacterized protein (TIGR02118 family)
MLIVLAFYKRKAGITRNQFSDHWRNVHGPLFARFPDRERYLIRYVQHHLSSDSNYPVPAGCEFDGFSEAWFTSAQAREEMFKTEYYLNTCYPDNDLFLDMKATRWVVFDEPNVVIGG